MSLQTKVLIAFLAVALLVILLLSGMVSVLLNNLFSRYLDATLGVRLSDVKVAVEEYYEAQGSFQGADVYFRGPSTMGGYGYVVADNQSRIVIGPPPLIGQTPTSTELSRGAAIMVRGNRVGTLIPYSMMGRIHGFAPLEQEFTASFYRGVITTGIGVLLLSLVLGIFISRRLAAPLRDIDVAASTLGAGDLSYRLPTQYKEAELRSLVHSFNDMAARLEQNERSRRNLVADVAHELRTPITILRVALESMLDGVAKPDEAQLASLYEEVSRMGRLIADLQDLSLAEAGKLKLNIKEIDLTEFIKKLLEHMRSLADERGVVLSLVTPQTIIALADQDRLAQVLINIISNAARHSQSPGEVVVSTALEQGMARVSIKDSGAGIAPSDLPFVFDRFYRGDKARHRDGGTGLGLAISKEFAQAMGGKIEVTSTLGQSTVFTVSLPLSQTTAS